MDRVRKSTISLIAISIMILLLFPGCKAKGLYHQILDFAKENEEIMLSRVTDFDWDIVYVDRTPYSSGSKIKEEYGIEGEFQPLLTDFSSRVAFCKDGKLVYDLELNNF